MTCNTSPSKRPREVSVDEIVPRRLERLKHFLSQPSRSPPSGWELRFLLDFLLHCVRHDPDLSSTRDAVKNGGRNLDDEIFELVNEDQPLFSDLQDKMSKSEFSDILKFEVFRSTKDDGFCSNKDDVDVPLAEHLLLPPPIGTFFNAVFGPEDLPPDIMSFSTPQHVRLCLALMFNAVQDNPEINAMIVNSGDVSYKLIGQVLSDEELLAVLQQEFKRRNFDFVLRIPAFRPAKKGSPDLVTDPFVVEAWNQPYCGNYSNYFAHAMDNSIGRNTGIRAPYSKIGAIVQSSGTGKSRLVQEVSKSVFTIFINLRGSNAQSAFPRSDTSVFNLFDDIANSRSCAEAKQRLYFFLLNLFTMAGRLVQKYTSLADWNKFLANEEKRLFFLDQVVSFKYDPKSPSIGYDDVDKMLNNLVKVVGSWTQHKHLKIFLAFDEAHTISNEAEFVTEAQKKVSLYDIFCSAIADLSSRHIFVVFLSTVGSLDAGSLDVGSSDVFGRSVDTFSSAREFVSAKHFPPYTALPFDLFAHEDKVQVGRLTLKGISSFRHLMKFGRPLWHALHKGGGSDAKIMTLARGKLTGKVSMEIAFDPHHGDPTNGIWEMTAAPLEDTAEEVSRMLALVGARVLLTFNPASETARQQEAELVRNHMRIAFSIPEHREYMMTGAPSEPVLAEAAAIEMYERNVSLIQIISKHTSRGLIEKGERGGLVARALLIRAFDFAVHSYMTGVPGGGLRASDDGDFPALKSGSSASTASNAQASLSLLGQLAKLHPAVDTSLLQEMVDYNPCLDFLHKPNEPGMYPTLSELQDEGYAAYSRPVRVLDYFVALFGRKFCLTVVYPSTPANRPAPKDPQAYHEMPRQKTFFEVFKNAFFCFTHFGRAKYDGPITARAAYYAFARCMAFQCTSVQETIDGLLPMLIFDAESVMGFEELIQTNLHNAKVSAAFLSYEDWSGPETKNLTVDADKLGFFCSADAKKQPDAPYSSPDVPYITLLLHLGVLVHRQRDVQSKGMKAAGTFPQEDRTMSPSNLAAKTPPPRGSVPQMNQEPHPRYSFIATGCSPTVYPNIIAHAEKEMWKQALEVIDDFSGHPDYHVEELKQSYMEQKALWASLDPFPTEDEGKGKARYNSFEKWVDEASDGGPLMEHPRVQPAAYTSTTAHPTLQPAFELSSGTSVITKDSEEIFIEEETVTNGN
ncbi:hypothetical protein FISHEDRAFT_74576 [Fistulina hepatica ATCC 64428]|uniref:Uncharacterized protein n=1 Tax=Fistulina hepatica ATCC 64428 TaxID=1128425 RepID=A0A0D7A9W5_9AGAR|nr:hypothetical protein FISHEDRAFT_74576 [Fistulina hepatica ATCC 64428]